MYPEPAAIICADWSKDPRKRSTYVARIKNRIVHKLAAGKLCTLSEVLAHASDVAVEGPVLVAFDVPIGVPYSYSRVGSTKGPFFGAFTFLDLLRYANVIPRFFEPTQSSESWSLSRPFFSVPAGRGGLTGYKTAASSHGVDLLRVIDHKTGAKSTFITSGIPGSVGSAAISLWKEIAKLLDAGDPRFRVWPFEGDLMTLFRTSPITIAEMYPRAAYATALLDGPTECRCRLSLAKTQLPARQSAIRTLTNTAWARAWGVEFRNLLDAERSEDDFDACITAAALLRCQLEDLPFAAPAGDFYDIEGNILSTGSINFALPERPWCDSGQWPPGGSSAVPQRISNTNPVTPTASNGRSFCCPIDGCRKVFHGTRGGWDGHVTSVTNHPNWYPQVILGEERKALFKRTFPQFFD